MKRSPPLYIPYICPTDTPESDEIGLVKHISPLGLLFSFVGSSLAGYDIQHDFSHAKRVYKLAMDICNYIPEANRKVITYASLLHDVNKEKARTYLEFRGNLTKEEIENILKVIDNLNKSNYDLETQIVSNADRIDIVELLRTKYNLSYSDIKNELCKQ